MKKYIFLLMAMMALSAQHTRAQKYFVSSLATPGAATFAAGQDKDGVLSIPFGAATHNIEVETNQKATVSSNADWCKASIKGKTLTLTVGQNNGSEARNAILTIESKDFHPLTITVRQEAQLVFAVISDTHVGNTWGAGYKVKIPQALKHLTARGKLDVLAVGGDLTDNGRADQYKEFVQFFGDDKNIVNPVGKFMFMMGNHDNYDSNGKSNYQQGLKAFNEGNDYPYHQYCLIKGYPFISLSDFAGANNDLNNSANGTNAYPAASQYELRKMLKRAAEEAPGKPIFVFTHVPPRATCYSSWPEYENGEAWCMSVLNPILNEYPQVVVFAGHSHYPLGDPRSIHQGTNPKSNRKNYYTAINTASTTYSEIHPGAVEEGIHPKGYEYVTEGMILVEQPNGDIEIRRYDTYRDLEIQPENRWVLKAPFDGSMFQYADIRDKNDNPNGVTLRDGLPAPVFGNGASLTLQPNENGVKVTFPQASDNECVFRYNIRILKGDRAVKNAFVFSQFYLNTEMPKTLSYTADGLAANTEYKVEVIAYDSYDNQSEALTSTFTTLDDDRPVPDATGAWTFDDTANLLAGTGVATLKGALIEMGSLVTVDNPSEANIEVVEGPTEGNGAIKVPVASGLMMTTNLDEQSLDSYSIMFDIRSTELSGYTALYQNDPTNKKDGSFFINNGQLGLNSNGLGYNGKLTSGQWHRVLFVVKGNAVIIYLDGIRIGQSSSANAQHWQMGTAALFFLDNDGEEHPIETSEIRFWDSALSDKQAEKLGTVDDGSIPEPDPVPVGTCWTFDNISNLTEETGAGAATLKGAIMENGTLKTVDNLADAGIKIAAGPDGNNGAISVPVGSGMMFTSNLDLESISSYALMFDICLDQTNGYTALFQNDLTNKKDGSFFVNNGQVGLNGSHGMGYNGSIISGEWHRVLFVVDEGFGTAYIDGTMVGQSSKACPEHWLMGNGGLLFLDNDGEEHEIKTAEIRFWHIALSPAQAKLLGGVTAE